MKFLLSEGNSFVSDCHWMLPRIVVVVFFKGWKSVYVSFQSGIYELITWDHWRNSEETYEPLTASTSPDCVPQQSLREIFIRFLYELLLSFCTLKINNVELNVTEM